MQKSILALQFRADLESNTANFATVERLYKGNPDILFLPEVWCAGWSCEDFAKKAQDENGEIITFLKDFARKNSVNIIGGSYIRKASGGLKNSVPIINRAGELLTHYDKNHLFIPDGEDCLTSGENLVIANIEGLKIGLSVCFDIRFPELFRSFAPMPDLLVNLAAWPKARVRHYEILSTARAIENQAYFLGLSQTGEIKDGIFNAGNSLLVSPYGDIVQKLGEGEDSILQTIDTNYVAEIRERFPNLKLKKSDKYRVEVV